MILVTGGAGYIGSHTCVELLNAGHAVVVLDNLVNGSRASLKRVETLVGASVPLVVGDVRDQKLVEDVLRQYDCSGVIHFAGKKAVQESWEKPLDYFDANVGGSLSVLNAMTRLGVKRLIFSSSAAVYGAPRSLPLKEDHPCHPESPYARSKLIVEDMLRDMLRSDPDWRVGILRYFNPIGAHPSGLIGENTRNVPPNLVPFVAQVAIGQRDRLHVWGNDYPTPDGTGVRDYLHVVDLAVAHVKALDRLGTAESFTVNLGAGAGTSVLELIRVFAKVSGRDIPYDIKPRRAGDVASYYADPTRAEHLLGWKATRTIDEMCSDYWRWQTNAAHHDRG